MNEENVINNNNSSSFDMKRIKELLIKYISSAAILGITTFFTPNFVISSFPILLLAALVIVILDYMVETITGIHDSPFGRGLVGFISATIIIYMTQFLVAGYHISIISSIIAALIYAVIDSFIPTQT